MSLESYLKHLDGAIARAKRRAEQPPPGFSKDSTGRLHYDPSVVRDLGPRRAPDCGSVPERTLDEVAKDLTPGVFYPGDIVEVFEYSLYWNGRQGIVVKTVGIFVYATYPNTNYSHRINPADFLPKNLKLIKRAK